MQILALLVLFFLTSCGFSDDTEYGATLPVKPNVIAPLPKVEEPKEAIIPIAEQNVVKIALLVPLTGDSAEVGKALMNAAELALFDLQDTKLAILPLDTKGTAEGAKEAVIRAISNNSRLILGPLFSEEAEAIAPIAARADVHVISFSNNSKLAERGIFLLGFTPQEQIERVVKFAREQNIRDFSALVPDNAFGNVAVDTLQQTLSPYGITTKKIERYKAIDANLSKAINRITNASGGAGPTSLDQDKYEALLIPEGGKNLPVIINRLYQKDNDSVRFRVIGSGQWDDPATAKEQRLIGSWFATSPPIKRLEFEDHFKTIYGYQPVRIASLAYDGVSLAALLSKSERTGGWTKGWSNGFSRSAITNPAGFNGVNGVFRFKENGLPERALSVLEVIVGDFREIDPAPTKFP